jgi:hypothetical protein
LLLIRKTLSTREPHDSYPLSGVENNCGPCLRWCALWSVKIKENVVYY